MSIAALGKSPVLIRGDIHLRFNVCLIALRAPGVGSEGSRRVRDVAISDVVGSPCCEVSDIVGWALVDRLAKFPTKEFADASVSAKMPSN
jgi:hypothetical protein